MIQRCNIVEIIPTTEGRTADFFIDGVRHELKTISNVQNTSSDGISSAIASRANDAQLQAEQMMVLDNLVIL